jgi:predicted butyrate kinase (DUF1464 family)
MLRVAGTDPGTSSLDVLLLEDGAVAGQYRFAPDDLRADPALPVRWLAERGPLDLVAGPSGYGLPLVRAAECTERDLALMSLVRPDERGHSQGVAGFSAVARAFRDSGLPVVFLPGVIHLPTVPAHRKLNRIDLGTPDKLCVAALALARQQNADTLRCCVVELGTAFTACLVLDCGRIVDGLGGTSGPCGWGSPGAWDGEVAYLLSPLAKRDLFAGGAGSVGDATAGRLWFCESLVKAVAALKAVTPFEQVLLSGRLLETEPELADEAAADLALCATLVRLESLPGAWVKHAAQGAALLADGLAGGRHAALVERLALREASGTVLDWLQQPRGAEVRALFGAGPT